MKKYLQPLVNFIKSPLARISFGLVMLTVSLLLISDFLGLMPDTRGSEIEYRQHIAESSAVQVSMEIGERDNFKLNQILTSTVERNDRVLSAAVRSDNGRLIDSVGDHANLWTLGESEQPTTDQIRVTLYTPKGEWGAFELVFKELPVSSSMFRGGNSVVKIVIYVALAGFIGFFFFLKKVMRELDPDQVLPDRVRSALDSLTDGLLIVNGDGVIMFCNSALANRIGINARKMTGKNTDFLDWVTTNDNDELPWVPVLNGLKQVNEESITLRVGHHQRYKFLASASPIKGEGTQVRGALITFNDVTELEKKHAELEQTYSELEATKSEIEEKNKELFTLATRDPLTNLFNRRAFFDAFNTIFEDASTSNSRLACIMLDIDHFKSVNDTHGHAVGDEVIKYMADVLTQFLGDVDIVGRFGGEEFCMLLPGASMEAAVQRAEKIRLHIEAGTGANLSVALSITSSFGVSILPSTARTPSELIEYADQALYEAKAAGRNRVVSWQGEQGGKQETVDSTGPAIQISNTRLPLAENSMAEPISDAEAARLGIRRRDESSAAPGATVLVESGKRLTQRQLLASNIETAIRRAEREDLQMAVVVLDGSSLQYIADNVDYHTGNKLCSVLVDRIKNMLRLADVVSQGKIDNVTGTVTQTDLNEIAVLLTDIDAIESIPSIVDRLLAVFDQRIVIAGVEYVVDTHAGVSVYKKDSGSTAESLLQNASVACSNARETLQRNSYSFYSPNMDEAAKRYIRLQSDLYQVIEKNELEVFFQPKMDLVSGELIGLEALLRWHHAQLGTIPPLEFIPMAEKTGFIHELNNWVMTEVVDQIKRWRLSGHTDIAVAVNVSAVELVVDGFADKVIAILEAAELSPRALEIEITESIGIDDADSARKNLEKLDSAGLQISIDDFGTGYASLGYLQQFPITRLKIDRMFVSDCTVDEKNARVVRSIITMGNSLGMRVLAEGVETREQLMFLRDHHCDEIQGYFVSRPVNAAETTIYLEKPTLLSQKVLACTMEPRASSANGAPSIPLSGLGAILSRFPQSANDDKTEVKQARSVGE